ncbi:Hypothetical protein, putative [Bodo saltans]|uniref:Uncharacterized protein n=1 Tax=Bodo saltans TaxID=75058 RepID=A0A0S4J630_BODSA|nr:Hypothetical protein, putative [Bodo saltans]|eukprot:CUG85626.1 Hypothetical protein, putative [Bodo saltans]
MLCFFPFHLQRTFSQTYPKNNNMSSDVTEDIRQHIRSVQRRLTRMETAVRCSTPPRSSRGGSSGSSVAHNSTTQPLQAPPTDLKQGRSSPAHIRFTPNHTNAPFLTSSSPSPSFQGQQHQQLHVASPQSLATPIRKSSSSLIEEEEEIKWLLADMVVLRARLGSAEHSLEALRHQHRTVTLEEKSKLAARLRVVQHQRERHQREQHQEGTG